MCYARERVCVGWSLLLVARQPLFGLVWWQIFPGITRYYPPVLPGIRDDTIYMYRYRHVDCWLVAGKHKHRLPEMAAEADRGHRGEQGHGGPPSYQEMREPAYLIHELKLQTLTEQGQARSDDGSVVAAGISRFRDVGWIIQPSSVHFYHLKTASHLATWRFEVPTPTALH